MIYSGCFSLIFRLVSTDCRFVAMFTEKPANSSSVPSDTELSEGEDYLSTKDLLLEMGKVLLLAIVIIIPIRVFLFQPFFVQGASMEPNFEDGEYLVIGEFGYKYTKLPLLTDAAVTPWKELERQTPIVFHPPQHPDQFYIKRVIGLPGEAVEIKSGKVRIYNAVHPDGFALDERAYLDSAVSMADLPRTALTDDQYFVMGDNRPFSFDSRSFGPIDKKHVIGRVLLRAWPASRIDWF